MGVLFPRPHAVLIRLPIKLYICSRLSGSFKPYICSRLSRSFKPNCLPQAFETSQALDLEKSFEMFQACLPHVVETSQASPVEQYFDMFHAYNCLP